MKLPLFTVTRKLAAGYLLVVCFFLVAIVYALTSLHAQTARSERLVSVDFRSLDLAREMRQNLLARENLSKQLLILREPTLIDLLEMRGREFETLWSSLVVLPIPELLEIVNPLAGRFQQVSRHCRDLLIQQDWESADLCLEQELAPLRTQIIAELENFSGRQKVLLDRSLEEFSDASSRAYSLTLALAFLGIGLSAPVAVGIIIGIQRAIGSLVLATQQIAAGSFEHRIAFDRQDEFGLLAREFSTMGRKLRELEQLRLDANPLTHLPGNLALEREMEKRIAAGEPFAHMYIDLDHFKAFNDRYGYQSGSEVIACVARLVSEVVTGTGAAGDLVGHIGGDDYVILSGSLENAEEIARELIRRFDLMIPGFYSEEDRRKGSFEAKDRFDIQRTFPLLTISIAIVWSGHLDHPSPQTISRECVMMKDHLKSRPGSNYLIDRRRNP